MKLLSTNEFVTPMATALLFKELSADDIKLLLGRLYLSLDFETRRNRFSCAVSDQSILRHCRELDTNRSAVFGCVGAGGLIAAVEFHAPVSIQDPAEIAFAAQQRVDRLMILDHLLQLAALTSADKGHLRLVVHLERSETDLIVLLRGLGRVHHQHDGVLLDLSEFARFSGRSN